MLPKTATLKKKASKMLDLKNEIHEDVRSILIACGLTSITKMTGVSQGHLSRIRDDAGSTPKSETLIEIVEKLDDVKLKKAEKV